MRSAPPLLVLLHEGCLCVHTLSLYCSLWHDFFTADMPADYHCEMFSGPERNNADSHCFRNPGKSTRWTPLLEENNSKGENRAKHMLTMLFLLWFGPLNHSHLIPQRTPDPFPIYGAWYKSLEQQMDSRVLFTGLLVFVLGGIIVGIKSLVAFSNVCLLRAAATGKLIMKSMITPTPLAIFLSLSICSLIPIQWVLYNLQWITIYCSDFLKNGLPALNNCARNMNH